MTLPPDKPDVTHLEVVFASGLLLDAADRIVLVIRSPDMIGVSLCRMQFIPKPEEIIEMVYEAQWITVFKDDPGELFVMEPNSKGQPSSYKVKEFIGAQANESADMAIGLGLASWGESWGGGWNEKHTPCASIPLPLDLPET